jgi:hypothetical protein
MLLTTSETAQKVQIQERKPIFILHAPRTNPSLTKNRKPIFVPNFEHLKFSTIEQNPPTPNPQKD